jgi:hypothetical protein
LPDDVEAEIAGECAAMHELVVEALMHRRLFDAVGLDASQQLEFMRLWVAHSGPMSDFWEAVRRSRKLGPARAADFQFAIQASLLVGNDRPLPRVDAQRLARRGRHDTARALLDNRIGSAADVAAFTRSEFVAAPSVRCCLRSPMSRSRSRVRSGTPPRRSTRTRWCSRRSSGWPDFLPLAGIGDFGLAQTEFPTRGRVLSRVTERVGSSESDTQSSLAIAMCLSYPLPGNFRDLEPPAHHLVAAVLADAKQEQRIQALRDRARRRRGRLEGFDISPVPNRPRQRAQDRARQRIACQAPDRASKS